MIQAQYNNTRYNTLLKVTTALKEAIEKCPKDVMSRSGQVFTTKKSTVSKVLLLETGVQSSRAISSRLKNHPY